MFCGQFSHTEPDLIGHLLTAHMDILQGVLRVESPQAWGQRARYLCALCGVAGGSVEAVIRHVQDEHEVEQTPDPATVRASALITVASPVAASDPTQEPSLALVIAASPVAVSDPTQEPAPEPISTPAAMLQSSETELKVKQLKVDQKGMLEEVVEENMFGKWKTGVQESGEEASRRDQGNRKVNTVVLNLSELSKKLNMKRTAMELEDRDGSNSRSKSRPKQRRSRSRSDLKQQRSRSSSNQRCRSRSRDRSRRKVSRSRDRSRRKVSRSRDRSRRKVNQSRDRSRRKVSRSRETSRTQSSKFRNKERRDRFSDKGGRSKDKKEKGRSSSRSVASTVRSKDENNEKGEENKSRNSSNSSSPAPDEEEAFRRGLADHLTWCSVCWVPVPRENIHKHKEGRKHRIAVENKKRGGEDNLNRTTRKIDSRSSDRSGQGSSSPGGDWCSLCNLSVSRGNMERHLIGKTHRDAVRASSRDGTRRKSGMRILSRSSDKKRSGHNRSRSRSPKKSCTESRSRSKTIAKKRSKSRSVDAGRTPSRDGTRRKSAMEGMISSEGPGGHGGGGGGRSRVVWGGVQVEMMVPGNKVGQGWFIILQYSV